MCLGPVYPLATSVVARVIARVSRLRFRPASFAAHSRGGRAARAVPGTHAWLHALPLRYFAEDRSSDTRTRTLRPAWRRAADAHPSYGTRRRAMCQTRGNTHGRRPLASTCGTKTSSD